MKLQAQAEIKLCALVKNGSLPASECGRAFLKLLRPVLDSGVVGWRRRGGGRRLVVYDPVALGGFYRQRFPNAATAPDTKDRVNSVARFRDTKALMNSESEIICIRVWRNDALLKDGKPFDAATLTVAHGLFSFLLNRNCPYALVGQWALVENPAVFMAVEQLRLDADGVIYGHGRISSRTLEWLAKTSDSSFRLLHLPDYDPLGLSEFLRLHSTLQGRIALHLPTDLGTRFARFSNSELLTRLNSQSILAQLRRSELSAIRTTVELIDRYNAGLEQEALLIPA